MMFTAFLGFRGLATLSNVAAPLIFLISGIGLAIASAAIGGVDQMFAIGSDGTLTMGAAVTMVVGAFAVGGVIQPDITRYSKNSSHSLIGTAIGYIIAHSFVIIAGYGMCLVTGQGDVAMAMLLTLGGPALLVLILAQWTTNDNNLYSSSLAFSNIFPVPKKKIVLIAGTIATIIGAFGLVNYLTNWLIILGTGVPPVAGIMIADYLVFNKSKYTYGKGTKYKSIGVEAFIAWILAIIVGFTFTWGISCINSLVVGLVAYIILKYIFKALKINGDIGNCVEDEKGLAAAE